MTKFIAISDTHNALDQVEVPDGDVLLHTGDISYRGRPDELKKFNDHIMRLPHKYKVLVPGNHDFLFESDFQSARNILDPSIKILIGQEINIEDKRIWGSPIQPWFYDWAFNRSERELQEYWRQIPEGIDILMTHCPPYGICDMVHRYGTLEIINVGDQHLLSNVQRVKPKYHIFGHIHEGYGTRVVDETTFINAAVMDERYNLVNKPVVFEL